MSEHYHKLDFFTCDVWHWFSKRSGCSALIDFWTAKWFEHKRQNFMKTWQEKQNNVFICCSCLYWIFIIHVCELLARADSWGKLCEWKNVESLCNANDISLLIRLSIADQWKIKLTELSWKTIDSSWFHFNPSRPEIVILHTSPKQHDHIDDVKWK